MAAPIFRSSALRGSPAFRTFPSGFWVEHHVTNSCGHEVCALARLSPASVNHPDLAFAHWTIDQRVLMESVRRRAVERFQARAASKPIPLR